MSEADNPALPTARFILVAEPFDETLDYFTNRLGFRIDVISPADDPDRATVSRHGLTVVLDRFGDMAAGPGLLELPSERPDEVGLTETAPNGTTIRFTGPGRAVEPPELAPSLVVSHNSDGSAWVTGRAGMQYRDLIPDRQGGRFIASHIRVPGSGPVPDWVHHHDIRFQIIYCRAGAATLVYEDQGEPFRFEAGDCVLQPPGIRHRVLETFDDMEVVELGCPARHDTMADHDMALPTGRHLPDRVYNGQRFVRFRAGAASPSDQPGEPWGSADWIVTDTGIAEATSGLGSVRIVQSAAQASDAVGPGHHDNELLFLYLLTGTASLIVGGSSHTLAADDSAVIPPDTPWTLAVGDSNDGPADVQLLEITVAPTTGQA